MWILLLAISDNSWLSRNIRWLQNVLIYPLCFLFIMILVGHDKRIFLSQNNITKVTTSTVQWIRLFHDHHSLYITIAYCILMGRFYKKFLSKKIFHWFVYFVVSFRSIRVNIFAVNIIRGHSKSTFIIGAGGGGGGGVVEKPTKTNRERGVYSMCVRSLFLKKCWDFQNEVL